VRGQDLSGMDDRRLTAYRAAHVGFVFQFYNLIPTLTALENVELARGLSPVPLDARETLEAVGLGDHLNQFPAQMSGGEQQRVSVARALCKNPTLLLCDEPTGALDSATGVQVLETLHGMSRARGKTVVVVTHNVALADAADRVIRLKNGRVTECRVNPDPIPVKEVAW